MKLIKTKNFTIAANEAGDTDATKVAILMPGRLDTKDYANFVSHLDFFAKHGYYAIAIDAPGTWDSLGELENYTTTTYINAINELIDLLGNRPTLLLGHSRGGATAMLASDNPSVIGLALINAAYGKPSAPELEKIKNNTLQESRDIPPGNKRTKEQRKFSLPMKYFEDGAKHDPIQALKNFKGAKLLVYATKDKFVPSSRVKEIFDELSEPKIFLEIDCTHDYRLYPEAIKAVEESLEKLITKYL